MGETVGIFRSRDYDSSSRIGRGTVSRTSEVAVSATGSVVALHVSDGDTVERGQLLFETVSGDLDGLYATGSTIVSTVSGVVASVNASAGATLNKGDTVLSVYPDDSLEIEIDVEEYDLGSIAVGDEVSIRFNWDENGAHDAHGSVRAISYLPESAEAGAEASATDAVYNAYVSFAPDDATRLGMTVVVTVPEEGVEETAAAE